MYRSTADDSVLNLDGVNLSGNHKGAETSGTVNVKGKSVLSDEIVLTTEKAKVNVDGTDGVVLNNRITGVGSQLNLENGVINLTENTQLTKLDATLTNTTVNLPTDDKFNGNNLAVNGVSAINLANNNIGEMSLNNVDLTGTLKLTADVDLKNKVMDKISAGSVTDNGGQINVTRLNLMSAIEDKKVVIDYADKNLANYVTYTGSANLVKTPIFQYKTSYNVTTDENGDPLGQFVFVRGSSGNASNFNPAVLPTATNTQTGSYTNQLQTFNVAFEHSAAFMNLPTIDRVAIKNQGKYAMSDDSGVGVFSPLMTKSDTAGFWIKPYATFENIPLRHGPKVNNIAYGTLVGYDTPIESLRHGWDRVFTYYIGYNGASQSFSGTDSYQNGGLVGFTHTLYKGNFFNATTISAGASVAENSTMYGNENATSLLAGIANKTGYNFEFKGGRFIIQPSFMMSYSFINTFDYTNAAGVRMESDPASMIQIAPGVKFIGNTKSGWQPYLAVNMIWNILAHSDVRANGVKLPDMNIDPYVQYGLGVQRRFGDRFLAYGQAMVQNGGRNGISLSFGLRWALGKSGNSTVPRMQRHGRYSPKDPQVSLKSVQ